MSGLRRVVRNRRRQGWSSGLVGEKASLVAVDVRCRERLDVVNQEDAEDKWPCQDQNHGISRAATVSFVYGLYGPARLLPQS